MQKPRVRCLIAKPRGTEGDVFMSDIVDLAEAHELMQEGYYVIGPDPQDMEALAQWEREHGSHS